MKLKPLPISRAKTAWGLLQDVKRAILAEPKRADMLSFIDNVDPEDGGPACGTRGCFAGWVSILGRKDISNSPRNSSAERLAYQILGNEMVYTFDKDPLLDEPYNFFNDGDGDGCGRTDPSTPAHARAVVNRINRFMRVNAKALKARHIAGR